MSTALSALRDSYSAALNALFDARDAAGDSGDQGLKQKIQSEIFETLDAQAAVQEALNLSVSANLDAVADALEERIQSQQAFGLVAAASVLQDALKHVRPVAPPQTIAGPNAQTPVTVTAAPGLPDDKKSIVRAIVDAATAMGLSPKMVLAIVAIESDFRARATNPVSSAGGLFQFIDSTWTGAGGSQDAGGGIGKGFAAHASIDEQITVGTGHLAGLKQRLVDNGIAAPTPTAIYMAHQQGLGGALKILTAVGTQPIEQVISAKAAQNNLLDGLTVAQVKQRFQNVVQAHLDEVRALLEVAPQTPSVAAAQTAHHAPVDRPLANKAPAIALHEMSTFARKNGVTVTEDREPLRTRGLEYFDFVKRPSTSISGTANAWSAAFISYVLHRAGLDETLFPFAPNHARYILKALQNSERIAQNEASAHENALTYHEIETFAPRVGDLVGYGSSKTVSPVTKSLVKTTDDLRKHLPNKHFSSHTDLVIDVRPGRLKVIGGNVSNTIGTKTYDLDADNRIRPGQKPFFVLAINV